MAGLLGSYVPGSAVPGGGPLSSSSGGGSGVATNLSPIEPFPGYSYSGSPTFALTDLTGLTSGQAHAINGDWRCIVFAVLQATNKYYSGLASEDKPVGFVIQRTPHGVTKNGSTAGYESTEFRVVVYHDVQDISGVMPEPTP